MVSAAAALALPAPAGAATVKRTGARSYAVTIGGAPQSDLTIAPLDFPPGAPARRPTRRALRVTVAGPTGLNHLPAGPLRAPSPATLTPPVALVQPPPARALAPGLPLL